MLVVVVVVIVVEVGPESSNKLSNECSSDMGAGALSGAEVVNSAIATSPNRLLVSSMSRSISEFGSTTALLRPGSGGGVMLSRTSATTALENPISSSTERSADSFIMNRPESIPVGPREKLGLDVALVSRGL